MHSELLHFFTAARQIKLSSEEREGMRLGLERECQENPMVSIAVSPSMKLLGDEKDDMFGALRQHMAMHPIAEERHSFFSVVTNYFRMHQVIATMFLVTILASSFSGIAYAAEGALPGDPLHFFKMNFNERMYEYFLLPKEKQVEWDMRLVQRREAEIEQLLYEGRMSGDIIAFFENEISKQKVKFEKRVSVYPPERQERMRERLEQKIANRMEMLNKIERGEISIEEVMEKVRAQRSKKLQQIERKRERALQSSEWKAEARKRGYAGY